MKFLQRTLSDDNFNSFSHQSLHPAHLMNQIMAVNLATSNFILRSSDLGKHINIINKAIDKLSSKTEEALFWLGRDMMEGTTPALKTSQDDSAFKFVSSDTIVECERACDLIADVEILLSRATSLLSKFPGEYDLVEHLLQNTEGKVDSYEGRQGILNIIRGQQQVNSGQEDIGLNDTYHFHLLENVSFKIRIKTVPVS